MTQKFGCAVDEAAIPGVVKDLGCGREICPNRFVISL